MKLLLDGHMLGTFEGGNERYIKNLAAELSEIDEVNLKVLVDKSYKGKGKIFVKQAPESDFQRVFLTIPGLADRFESDIVHSTYIGPINLDRNRKLVLTVHDVAFRRFPEFYVPREKFIFDYLFPLCLRRADAIIVPSDFTKKEFLHFYPQEKLKVHVTPEASDPIFKPQDMRQAQKNIESSLGIKAPFILTFNSKLKKRNINGVIKAFSRISQRFPDITLIVVGGNYNISGFQTKTVKVLERVDDEDLANLYAASEVVVYVPFYEGFGLPVLEALSSKTCLVISDIPVLREIVRRGAVYVNPNKPADVADAILKILENKSFARNLREQGRKEAKKFSWRETAVQTFEVYKKILKY